MDYIVGSYLGLSACVGIRFVLEQSDHAQIYFAPLGVRLLGKTQRFSIVGAEKLICVSRNLNSDCYLNSFFFNFILIFINFTIIFENNFIKTCFFAKLKTFCQKFGTISIGNKVCSRRL